MKLTGFQRTKQKSWPFYSGKDAKLLAMEVVFDFIETNMKAHYSDTAWEKPTSAQLSAVLDTLLAPPVAIPNG